MKNWFKLMILAVVFISSRSFAEEKPNILFIIGDDLGVDAIEGFNIGERHPTTPNLDKLRESGITFTNVWATPVCAASRASLLTGKYGLNNGVPSVPGILSTEHKSIFKEIDEQSNGEYVNCLIGKWHLAKNNNYNHPFEHDVDEYMGVLGAGVKDYYKWYKYEDGQTDTCYTYASQYFTNHAIDWIKDQQKPWFMWMAHVSPHTPLHVPPEGTFSVKNTDINKRKYKAMIESMDYEIGRLLDSIPADVLENTIIIFLGDNGTPANLLSDFPDNRGKQTVYQGGINVPLIISGNGITRQNEIEDALINVSDFYITFSQIVNPDAFPSDSVFDSYSFKHLLDGSIGANRAYNYMGMGANSNVPNDLYTVRNQQYKLIDLGNGTLEFYDLEADTFELSNLWNVELSVEQENAKNELLSLMTSIRGEEPYIKEPDTVTSPVGIAGKYPIVHTSVSNFHSTNSEIETPETTDVLYWQDAGRITNSPSYTDNGDGTITDMVTGLMWEKDMGEKITWSEAVEKVKNLNVGGYEDWRIPTIKELYSLILFTGRVMGSEAVTEFIDTDYFIQPFGDESIGERSI
ncbi:MAG: sulfatase-like hydrolase/transferase, partial [Draconibacterium sp.]|nr:sulfatase-like hydrolase/transferase [Draconibacterium sp.]